MFYIKRIWVVALFVFIFLPGAASAHQPRIVTGTQINVVDPEISKAYYGQLSGAPHIYHISSDKPFILYVGLLVPDRPGQKKDVSALVLKKGEPDSLVARLNGLTFDWKPYYENFGADNYFEGPEYNKDRVPGNTVPAGNYEITVSSPNNDSRYTLAVGDTESFPLGETVSALRVIPQLKRDFFASSPFTFLKSPFGIGFVVIMFIFAFITGLIYRLVLKHLAKNDLRKRNHNIGKGDRALRALLGAGLLLLGIYFWSAILLFLAGFCFFEAIFSWCGLYAALGKNTCPL